MASGHVNRTNRPNTWLHRPACKCEEKPCQLGAVHTWHIASFRCGAKVQTLLEVKRTCRARRECVDLTKMTQLGDYGRTFSVMRNAISFVTGSPAEMAAFTSHGRLRGRGARPLARASPWPLASAGGVVAYAKRRVREPD